MFETSLRGFALSALLFCHLPASFFSLTNEEHFRISVGGRFDVYPVSREGYVTNAQTPGRPLVVEHHIKPFGSSAGYYAAISIYPVKYFGIGMSVGQSISQYADIVNSENLYLTTFYPELILRIPLSGSVRSDKLIFRVVSSLSSGHGKGEYDILAGIGFEHNVKVFVIGGSIDAGTFFQDNINSINWFNSSAIRLNVFVGLNIF